MLVLWLQNPFVVCKLFKKQDVVHQSCDVEPAVSSPTEVSEVSLAFPKSEETTKPCDVGESSLSEISAPEVTTSEVRMNITFLV